MYFSVVSFTIDFKLDFIILLQIHRLFFLIVLYLLKFSLCSDMSPILENHSWAIEENVYCVCALWVEHSVVIE